MPNSALAAGIAAHFANHTPMKYLLSFSPIWLAAAVTCLLIGSGLPGNAPALRAQETAPAKLAYEPTTQFQLQEVAGWRVWVPRRLLEPQAVVGRQALDLLRHQLQQISLQLPAPQVEKLRQVPIWLDDDPQDHRSQYHPSREWLSENGYNPDRARSVDLCDAAHFIQQYRHQPAMVLHELAHAYHHQVLTYEDERIQFAFQQATESGRYESVLRISGEQVRHYALSNEKEYFAECTEAFFSTNDFYPFVRAELKRHDPAMYRLLEEIWLTEVTAPPDAIVETLQLDPFYQKHVSAGGLPVVSSAAVSDAAVLEAAYLIQRMLAHRPELFEKLVQSRVRFTVLGVQELTTQVPEYRDLMPKNYWDRRARGLGATAERPSVSCGEENLLGHPGDPYQRENILVHEFAHTIHLMGLRLLDVEFEARLQASYQQAMNEGLWQDTYAATNAEEYWAEGVQSYFNTNRHDDKLHNHVDTREELKEYDPRLFSLIDQSLGANPWRYTRPEKRARQAHLRDVDRASLATFAWPDHLREPVPSRLP